MGPSANQRAVRWLRAELPALVSSGTISAENAQAIERYYEASARGSHKVGFVLLAVIGSILVAAGIVLLIAHNWDDFSRPIRSVIAFLPLLAAQALSAFVLMRRDESQAWRESAAIFNVAAVGTAISLVSQTYQIHGSLANFILVWMLLSIPLVYLMRTTLGAVTYLIGAAVWLFTRDKGSAASIRSISGSCCFSSSLISRRFFGETAGAGRPRRSRLCSRPQPRSGSASPRVLATRTSASLPLPAFLQLFTFAAPNFFHRRIPTAFICSLC